MSHRTLPCAVGRCWARVADLGSQGAVERGSPIPSFQSWALMLPLCGEPALGSHIVLPGRRGLTAGNEAAQLLSEQDCAINAGTVDWNPFHDECGPYRIRSNFSPRRKMSLKELNAAYLKCKAGVCGGWGGTTLGT